MSFAPADTCRAQTTIVLTKCVSEAESLSVLDFDVAVVWKPHTKVMCGLQEFKQQQD